MARSQIVRPIHSCTPVNQLFPLPILHEQPDNGLRHRGFIVHYFLHEIDLPVNRTFQHKVVQFAALGPRTPLQRAVDFGLLEQSVPLLVVRFEEVETLKDRVEFSFVAEQTRMDTSIQEHQILIPVQDGVPLRPNCPKLFYVFSVNIPRIVLIDALFQFIHVI